MSTIFTFRKERNGFALLPARWLSWFSLHRRCICMNKKESLSKAQVARLIYDGTVVISGIAGRFPKAANILEFQRNLLNREDLTTETEKRWTRKGDQQRMGFLDCLDKFDAAFFNLTPRQADMLDPQVRLLMEASLEAIVDAGYSPSEIRGGRTGVFCGALGGEALDNGNFRYNKEVSGYYAVSRSNFSIPARIAFALDLQGTSAHVSSACSSSLTALETAVQHIRFGNIDAAIVTGSNVILNPRNLSSSATMGALALDGQCKAFDESADGLVRAEVAVAILLQREELARRRYGSILHVRSNTDGFKHSGLTHPSGHMQEELFRETYGQIGIDPGTVSYIEAHGTGTPSGDPEEFGAIYRFFCKNSTRKAPLLLGSVKSNMGHGESGAGMASLAKIIVTIQTGIIPGNLHFKTPRAEFKEIIDEGKLKIVSENTPYDGGLIGVNCFGIGGTNSNLIVQSGNTNSYELQTVVPKEATLLVPMAGRTEKMVLQSLKQATLHAHNAEYLYLLQKSFGKRIEGLSYRGFALSETKGENPAFKFLVENCGHSNPPLWIIFPGIGVQWAGMGMDLMPVQAFAASIQKSRATIRAISGLDLYELISAKDSSILHDIYHALIATTAIQIALWDTVEQLLPPNCVHGLIGHSNGELLCAYADGCVTSEEALLLADAAGRAHRDGKKAIGAMAAVGLSAEEIGACLPPAVQIACIDSPKHVTVSGEAKAVFDFVEQLKTQGKFAVLINSCHVACHSWLTQEAADLFAKYARGTLPEAHERLKRSSSWVSTIFPEEVGAAQAQTFWGGFACVEYLAHCMRSPVLFHQAVLKVPPRSVVLELSPRGYMCSLLSESLPSDCVHISPMILKETDGLSHFYECVGRMYTAGLEVDMTKLFAEVSLPVSANTPYISPLIHWEHSDSWKTHIMSYPMEAGYEVVIDLQSTADSSIEGHKVGDSVIYPATGYIFLAWTRFAEALGTEWQSTSVIFQNVKFHRAMVLRVDVPEVLLFSFLAGTGKFELKCGDTIMASGTIETLEENNSTKAHNQSWSPKKSSSASAPWLPLKASDIYKELRLRGLNYSGEFQGIQTLDNEGQWADVSWTGNWIAFLDSLLQASALTSFSRNIVLPVEIEMLQISPVEFFQHLGAGVEEATIRINVNKMQNIITCPGIQLNFPIVKWAPRKNIQHENLIYEKYAFTPYVENDSHIDKQRSTREMIDLALENSGRHLEVADVFLQRNNSTAKLFTEIMNRNTHQRANLHMATLSSEIEMIEEKHKQWGILRVRDDKDTLVPRIGLDLAIIDDPTLLSSATKEVKSWGFILLHSAEKAEAAMAANLLLISTRISEGVMLALYRKEGPVENQIIHFPVRQRNGYDFEWVARLQKVIDAMSATGTTRLYISSRGQPTSGVLGFLNCLLQEDVGCVRCIFDPEQQLELNFEDPSETLKSIIKTDLVVNVVRDGKLGSYRHTPIELLGESKPLEHAYGTALVPGDLSSLSWMEAPLHPYYPFQEETCEMYKVAYAALNFRDILLATRVIPIEPRHIYKGPNMGFEFSGWDTKGDRVMGIGDGSLIATWGWADPDYVWPVPANWTLEEAATVPVAYATAFYALHIKGRLEPAQTVLIHAGTGGTGMASIYVALALGCEVFTTAGNTEKRNFIKAYFPQIGDDHIGSSRDASFAEQFLQVTNGHGIQVVLNSLEGEALMAGVRCLSDGGKFIDISVSDAFRNTSLGMRPFLKSIEYIAAKLNNFFTFDRKYKDTVKNMILDGIACGIVRPLPRNVFHPELIEQAFRFMASTKHVGKLLLKIQGEDKTGGHVVISAIPRSYFSRNKSYIIIGGLGGFGLEVANWMLERGARRVVLTSRSGVTNGYQSLCLRKWKEVYGVSIATPIVNLSTEEDAEVFLKNMAGDSAKLEVGGIFNCAMVLLDAEFRSQCENTFAEVAEPKAKLVETLDRLSRKYCPNIDYFVVFSSIASGEGNAEQSNYGWANSVMERICENRVADGLHGLAVQWGYVGQVGYIAEVMAGSGSVGEFVSTLPQDIESCLEVLDAALQQRNPIVCSFVAAHKEGHPQRRQLRTTLKSQIEKIFGIKDLDLVDQNRRLSELGLDSITTFELKQILAQNYNLHLAREGVKMLTIGDMKAIEAGEYIKQGGKYNTTGGNDGRRKCLFKLESAEAELKRNLFLVHGAAGGVDIFRSLSRKLHLNVYAYDLHIDVNATTISGIATRYIKELKSVQPRGPYTLGGYSSGACIAYEMALQLEQPHGDEVTDLVFLDGRPTFKNFSPNEWRQSFISAVKSSDPLKCVKGEQWKEVEPGLSGNLTADLRVLENLAFALIPRGAGVNLRQSINQWLTLAKACAGYTPTKKFLRRTFCIQPSSVEGNILKDKSEITEHCIGPIIWHEVEGSDHESFLATDNVGETAKILNKLLV